MIQPLAKEKGTTPRGNRYTLIQDRPDRIHLTLQQGNYLIAETLEQLRSHEEMIHRRDMLENELIDWIRQREPTHETAEQVLHAGGSVDSSGKGMGTTDSSGI